MSYRSQFSFHAGKCAQGSMDPATQLFSIATIIIVLLVIFIVCLAICLVVVIVIGCQKKISYADVSYKKLRNEDEIIQETQQENAIV